MWYTHGTENSIAEINEIESSCVRTDDVFLTQRRKKTSVAVAMIRTKACYVGRDIYVAI